MNRKRMEILTLVLMSAQALSGLLFDVYRDQDWVRLTWFGNDLVTLVVVLPLYAAALFGKKPLFRMIHYGCLGYAVYNYAFYLFGAALNIQFPLYVAIFVLAVVNLVVNTRADKMAAFDRLFDHAKSNALVAGIYLFIGLGLGSVWLLLWFSYVFLGRSLPVAPEQFRLVASLDLSFIVTLFFVSALNLIRRKPLGYLLGAIVGIQGSLYLLVLTLNSALGFLRTREAGELPMWATLFVIETLGTVLLARKQSRP